MNTTAVGIPVVFMANDRFLGWVGPFLRSLRAAAPDAAVWCIPFADDMAGVRALAATHDVRFLDADWDAIDAFAARWFPNDPYKRRRLRKLAAFDLPGGRFLYLDCDLVALAPLGPAIAAAAAAPADLVYLTASPDWVVATAAEAEARLRFGAAPRFSTGAMLSLSPGFDAAGALETLGAHLPLWRRLRAPWVVDQPAINLVAWLRGLRLAAFEAVVPGWAGCAFALDPAVAVAPDGSVTRAGRRVLCLHWPGEAKLTASPSLAGIAARWGLPTAPG